MPEGNFFHYDQAAVDHLARKDKKLAAAMQAIGPVRREVMPDLFQALMHAITGQQISMAAQRTVWGRLCGLLGEVTPQALLAQPQTALQALGLSARKVDYMRGIARQVVDGELDPARAWPLWRTPKSAAVLPPCAASASGRAEMLLLFSLQRSDILSYDDLAIRRGLRMLYRHKEMPRERFERYRRRFSPYGSLASLYLWAIAGGALPELDDPAERKKGISRPAAKLTQKHGDERLSGPFPFHDKPPACIASFPCWATDRAPASP